jgi:DNA-directed RNA polymerase I subunit RPA2
MVALKAGGVQAYNHRTDTKLYRLYTPQKPIARTKQYDELCMDEYPQGTNMVVAVCAYTGFDMEDAMILNKGSVDRGLAHGAMLKTEVVDLNTYRCAHGNCRSCSYISAMRM